jgi:hypothetical protein
VRACDRCQKRKCNKIYKIPVGSPTQKVFRICGRCLTYNAQKTRKWLDEREQELRES